MRAWDIVFWFAFTCQVVIPSYYYLVSRHYDRYDEQWAFRMFSPDGQSGADISWLVNGEAPNLRSMGLSDGWIRLLTAKPTPLWILDAAAMSMCRLDPNSTSTVSYTRMIGPFNAEGGDAITTDPTVIVFCKE